MPQPTLDFVLRDIHFGSKAPAGKEANRVKTVPDKGYLMILRLYSPKEAFFNRPGGPTISNALHNRKSAVAGVLLTSN